MGDVHQLDPTNTMKPEQALAHAAKREWDDVLVCGYDPDGSFCVVSSHMTCQRALWLAKLLEKFAMEGT